MSEDNLTKAEIMAMLEVQKEAATQMEKVASSLHDISKNQEAILAATSDLEKAFRNGMCDKVVEKVNEKVEVLVQPFATGQATALKDIETVKANTTWLKHIIGGATLIILIVTAFMKSVTLPPSHSDINDIVSRQMESYHASVHEAITSSLK